MLQYCRVCVSACILALTSELERVLAPTEFLSSITVTELGQTHAQLLRIIEWIVLAQLLCTIIELNYDLCSGHTRSPLALLVTTHFQVKKTTVSKLETGSLSETVVVSCPCRAHTTGQGLVTFGQFLGLH